MPDQDPPEIAAAHDLTTALRAEGYTVGFKGHESDPREGDPIDAKP